MENENQTMKGGKKSNTETTVQYIVIAVLAILLVYNGIKIYGAGNSNISGQVATGAGTVSALDVLPKGTPEIYGSEIGVSYDDISASNPSLADATMAKLTKYEDMQLDSAQMERYVKIGSSIACEYCCGAKTLVLAMEQ